MTEEALVRRLAWYFRNSGYVVGKEVPLGMRAVDLYCVNHATGVTVAVEAKLRDWGRAIAQARVYKLAADFAYIALPERAVTPRCVDACSVEGIGIISLPQRGRAQLILAATHNQHQQRMLVHRALSALGPKLELACLYS